MTLTTLNALPSYLQLEGITGTFAPDKSEQAIIPGRRMETMERDEPRCGSDRDSELVRRLASLNRSITDYGAFDRQTVPVRRKLRTNFWAAANVKVVISIITDRKCGSLDRLTVDKLRISNATCSDTRTLQRSTISRNPVSSQTYGKSLLIG